MQRRLRIAALATCTGLAALASGCANGHGSIRSNAIDQVAMIPDTHLIFNPDWTQIPPLVFRRSEWPIAYGYDRGDEIVDYRETFYDRQRQNGRSRDQFTRSFYSVRRGRARR